MHDGWQYLALMRHGHSYANAAIKQGADSQYYSVSGSDQDVEIDARGRVEVACAAKTLASLFPSAHPISAIWTSPFKRVMQSADTVLTALGYPLSRSADARLSKRSYGKFWNLSYKGVEEFFPEENKRFCFEGPIDYRPPEGENYPDLFDRADKFFDEHLAKSTGNVLVLTHLVVVLAFQRRIEQLPDQEVLQRYEQSAIANATVILYRRRNENQSWQFYRQFVADQNCVLAKVS
jgi:probable phosphoglycerate mutase